MSTPSSDEKVCPFCAETIRAAAVKCRFCHSDLPLEDVLEPAGPVAASPDVVPEHAFEGAADEDEPLPEHSSEQPRGRALVIGLLVAGVLLAAGSVWLVVNGLTEDNARTDGLRIGGAGQVVTTSFRQDAMSAAAANAVVALSYSYKTLDADQARAKAVMSPTFVEEYEEVMKQASPKAVASRLTLKATVAASSLVSVETGRAVALLYVNAVTTAEDSPKEQLNQNRVLMTMTRKDGAWIVSKIDAF